MTLGWDLAHRTTGRNPIGGQGSGTGDAPFVEDVRVEHVVDVESRRRAAHTSQAEDTERSRVPSAEGTPPPSTAAGRAVRAGPDEPAARGGRSSARRPTDRHTPRDRSQNATPGLASPADASHPRPGGGSVFPPRGSDGDGVSTEPHRGSYLTGLIGAPCCPRHDAPRPAKSGRGARRRHCRRPPPSPRRDGAAAHRRKISRCSPPRPPPPPPPRAA